VLGMDLDAHDWQWNVAAKAVLPIGLLLVLVIGAAVAVGASRRVDASPKPVLRRLLPSLGGMVILLMAGAAALLWHQHRHQMADEVAADTADVVGDLRGALAEQSSSLAAILRPIAADPGVHAALRGGDAGGLLATWRPVFDTLTRDNHVTHFYFLDAQRVCLLRLHKPVAPQALADALARWLPKDRMADLERPFDALKDTMQHEA
jgi:hypothetical protein